MAGLRWLAWMTVLAACGPSSRDDDAWPRNCGVEGPVELFAGAVDYVGATPVGEHVLLVTLAYDETPEGVEPTSGTWDTLAVPRCGGEQVSLERLHVDADDPDPPVPSIGVAGAHVLSCDRTTGRIDVLDPTGERPAKLLFDRAVDCRTVPVAGGLAAVDAATSRLLFAPDPGAGDIVALIDDVARSADEDARLAAFDEVPAPWILAPRAAGDALLVPMSDGSLVEIDATSGRARTLLADGLASLEVMTDARHVLWTEQDRRAYWLDRGSDVAVEVGSADAPAAELFATRDWIVWTSTQPPVDPPPPDPWRVVRAVDLRANVVHTLSGRDDWKLVTALSEDALIVDLRFEGGGEDVRHVYRPARGELVRLDFPQADRDATYRYRDGVIAYSREDGAELGKLESLGGDGRTVELVLDRVPADFVLASDDRIAFVERPASEVPGRLLVHVPDSGTVMIDEEVLQVVWPPRRTSAEGAFAADELIYAVRSADGIAVRRTVIP